MLKWLECPCKLQILDNIKVSAQEHHDKEYVELDLEKDGNISLEVLKIYFGPLATASQLQGRKDRTFPMWLAIYDLLSLLLKEIRSYYAFKVYYIKL